jgi:competence protein ComEA
MVMKQAKLLLMGTIFGLLSSAIIIIIASPQHGKAMTLIPLSTPGPIIVYVTGAVNKPGIYSLPIQSRVNDAIQAAGGMLDSADERLINLAARITDGERIVVNEEKNPTTSSYNQDSPGNPDPIAIITPSVDFPIDINHASLEDFDRLPGIGPSRAQDIITYREINGPFKSIEDLTEIIGIGPAIFDQIKPYITVVPPP